MKVLRHFISWLIFKIAWWFNPDKDKLIKRMNSLYFWNITIPRLDKKEELLLKDYFVD